MPTVRALLPIAAFAASAAAGTPADPGALIGAFCPLVASLPELPREEDLPPGWEMITERPDAPGAEEWEIPLRLVMLADGWTVAEWLDPYAGVIRMEASFVSGDACCVDSVQALAEEAAAELAARRGSRRWSAGGWFLYVLAPPDSTEKVSDVRFWLHRVTDSTLEMGLTVSSFHGATPYSLPRIPVDDPLGDLDRADLRSIAIGRLIAVVEEEGLFDQAGEDGICYSASLPEGAEIDPLQGMVEVTAREMHCVHGDPATAPVAGFFLVQPVSGEVMIMDRLTGEYSMLRE